MVYSGPDSWMAGGYWVKWLVRIEVE